MTSTKGIRCPRHGETITAELRPTALGSFKTLVCTECERDAYRALFEQREA